jgi:hypothetical protein
VEADAPDRSWESAMVLGIAGDTMEERAYRRVHHICRLGSPSGSSTAGWYHCARKQRATAAWGLPY